MIKVLILIFSPSAGWDEIAAAQRGVLFILGTCLLPLLALVAWLEGWGLLAWGKWQPQLGRLRHFEPDEVYRYETIEFFLSLAVVFITGLLVLKVSQTFHGRPTYRQAFTVVAYGLSPLFLLRLLDAAPNINPMITWGLGLVVTIWVLYQGLPRVMDPDPTHAFGLYLVTVIIVILTTGLTRLVTAMYLVGWMDYPHSYLGRKLAPLLGQ